MARAEPLRVKLEPGHTIRGRVVDAVGRPIANVGVAFSDGDRGLGIGFGGTTSTDESGRFQFDSLPKETAFSFRARTHSTRESLKLPLDGLDEVIVTLPEHGIIKGKVLDAATGRHHSRDFTAATRLQSRPARGRQVFRNAAHAHEPWRGVHFAGW